MYAQKQNKIYHIVITSKLSKKFNSGIKWPIKVLIDMRLNKQITHIFDETITIITSR